jgi:hypothetical protein
MKVVRWLIPMLSLTAVLVFTWWDLSRADAGPGPLHPSHAAVASLQGGANCAGCHRDGAVSAPACLQCHAAIAEQSVLQTGLHATLTQSQCALCHPEHHGDAAPLLPPHAFQRAGIGDMRSYDHRHVAFELSGAHSQLTCVRCHPHADDMTPPAGGRFLGLSQQCTSCHEDVHAGAFGGNCVSCHGQTERFAAAPGFSHDRFALHGAHGQAACIACHQQGSGREVELEEQQQLAVRSCRECHANPHEGQAGSVQAALWFAKADDCARCHATDSWPSAQPTLAEHAELGFPLRGLHAEAKCATCHGTTQTEPMWQGDAPSVEACAVCHASPHAEELVRTATAQVGPERGCAGCHGDQDQNFTVGTMSAEQHRATGFALAVPHADLACSKCHEGASRETRFPGRMAADCRSCHQDVHQGQFVAAGMVQQCTECHHAERFLPHRFGVSAHAASYALTGANDAVTCNACHKEVKASVRQFVGTTRVCGGCHQDVHQGQFDRSGRPATVNGEVGCARCHNTATFQQVVTAFDHKLWTGVELAGAHAAVACSDCHNGPVKAGVDKVAGTQCASCHEDPHLGQFRVGGRSDCQRCHNESTWQQQNFDHQKQSRFALDEQHKNLACSKCHIGYPVGGVEVIRYKPLGTSCGDCHQLGAGGGVDKGTATGTAKGTGRSTFEVPGKQRQPGNGGR